MPIPVPGSFDDITCEWFGAALLEGGLLDVQVASIEVEPMHPSKGLIGDLATVRATYRRGAGPREFAVKLPAANRGSRNVGKMLRAYSREVAFYRHVAPFASGTHLPRCYYSGQDESADRWAIVLEFIYADKFDFIAGATASQAAAAIDALADFHAIWWQSDTKFGWMPGLDAGGLGGLEPLWAQNLPTFIERYRQVLPGPTADWVLAFAPGLKAWSDHAATEPLTMVHSDYRLDNLMLRGDDVTIIDWQTAMRAPAAMDVSCFLATSLDLETRRTTEAELISRYLSRLGSHDVQVSASWFEQSYDENLLWWMGQFGNNLAHLSPNDDAVNTALETMAQRVYTAGLDRNVGRLI